MQAAKLVHLANRDAQLTRDLLDRRLPAEVLLESVPASLQQAERIVLVGGQAHDPRVILDRSDAPVPDPPEGVRQRSRPARRVEAFGRSEQPRVSLLHEIRDGQTEMLELGDLGQHEAQIVLDELVPQPAHASEARVHFVHALAEHPQRKTNLLLEDAGVTRLPAGGEGGQAGEPAELPVQGTQDPVREVGFEQQLDGVGRGARPTPSDSRASRQRSSRSRSSGACLPNESDIRWLARPLARASRHIARTRRSTQGMP